MLTRALVSLRKPALVVLLAVPFLLTSACMDYEAGAVFNKDMTGKATFKMTMDLGPFVNNMAGAMAARGGGPPPEEMISQLKSELGSQLSTGLFDIEKLKKNLPAGVTLTDSAQKLDDLKVIMSFSFAFTDATKLPLIELPPPQLPSGATATIGSNSLKPFDGLVFAADDTTMTIASKPKSDTPSGSDPEATKAAALAAVNQTKTQLEAAGMGDLLKGLKFRMAMRFEVPQTVIEQNATRKEGDAYIWEVKIDDFGALDKLPDQPLNVKLKFKK